VLAAKQVHLDAFEIEHLEQTSQRVVHGHESSLPSPCVRFEDAAGQGGIASIFRCSRAPWLRPAGDRMRGRFMPPEPGRSFGGPIGCHDQRYGDIGAGYAEGPRSSGESRMTTRPAGFRAALGVDANVESVEVLKLCVAQGVQA